MTGGTIRRLIRRVGCDQFHRYLRWPALLAVIVMAGCTGGPHTSSPRTQPLPQLLLGGRGSQPWQPCQETLFASECASAIGSTGVTWPGPPVQEFILRYRTAAEASAAEQSQRRAELSTGWLCSVPSQCPVTPLDVSPVGTRRVQAVTFTIGERGNLSESMCLAAVTKGAYLVSLSWICASELSASRITSSTAARALLTEAVSKVPG